VRRPVYVGDVHAFAYIRAKSKTGKPVMRLRPESERTILTNVAPALVSREAAEEASRRLTSNRSSSTRNNRDPEAALLRGGYARCSYCGRVAIAINTSRGTLYRCNGVNRDRYGCPGYGVLTSTVDTDVWSQVTERLLDPGLIAIEVDRLVEPNGPAIGELAATDRRLDEIGRAQQKLARRISAIDDDEVTAPLEAELGSLARQATRLRTEREAIKHLCQEREAMRERLADMASWCKTVAANVDRLTYDQKRLALDAFGVQVRLWAKGDRIPQWEITALPEILSQSSC